MRRQKKVIRGQIILTFSVIILITCVGLPHDFWGRVEPTVSAAPMTFTVNSTADDNDENCGAFLGQDCTLREAIIAANSNPGLDTINFQIRGSIVTPVRTIMVGASGLGRLPTITDAAIIDGTTQANFAGTPIIELSGSNAGTGAPGLEISTGISSGSSRVKGLAIYRFSGDGIQIIGPSFAMIEGNYIGTDNTGAAAGLGNGGAGISISLSSNNLVGGDSTAARNVISGNQRGIQVLGGTSNSIRGNYIGTNATGTGALGNTDVGVILKTGGMGPGAQGSSNNFIGSLAPGAGNLISGNAEGVRITGGFGFELEEVLSRNNTIQGNFIGTDVTGSFSIGNSGCGVCIEFNSRGNLVGGTSAAARNIISGNNGDGVRITGSGATRNIVKGNYIGLISSGTARIGNRSEGVEISNNADLNTIGGDTSGAGNVIAGNRGNGLLIDKASSNSVQGNFIGTNAGGTADLGNELTGIAINNASSNLIGGTVVSARNIISGNNIAGIFIGGDGSPTGNAILGNYIGTSFDGLSPLGNTNGVMVFSGSNNVIGGITLSGANIIAHNDESGVRVGAGTGTGNSIRFNSIFSNGQLGIDLTPAGVTPNDTIDTDGDHDSDGGPNNLQNFPVLTSAITQGSLTTIQGTLNSTPNTRFGIEVFANASCDSSGHGEGQIFLREAILDGDPNGNIPFLIVVPAVPSGQFITATATLMTPTGQFTDTSEFSRCVQVVAPGAIHFSAGSFTVNENSGTANITVTRVGGSDGTVSINFATSNGTATAGSDYTSTSGRLGFGNGETSRTFTVPIFDDTVVEGNETANLTLSSPSGGATLIGPSTAVLTIVDNDSSPTPTPTPTPLTSVQFSAASFSVLEDCTSLDITVTRVGNTSGATIVDYATSSGTASDRADYTAALGTLFFESGEAQKTFAVLITEDSRSEGTESATISLSNPSGATLGTPSVATIEILDDPSEPGGNAIDDAGTFACQHYHDLLNRQPDAAGLAFWTNEITSCGANAQCIDLKRTNVSAAFFLSIEFQETGYLVYRMYKAAYGDTTAPNIAIAVPIIRLHEFLPDAQRIGQGVQVGIGDWQAKLEGNKNAYALEFVARQRFLTDYPLTMTPAQFVDKLNLNAGDVLSQTEREQLIAALSIPGDVTGARAFVLRKVAEDADLRERETNRAFVLMQYYGYMRRNPDDPQDTDFRGWEFWLNKLNQFNGNFVQAEMVKAFITSIEYRQRFGQ